MELLQLKRFLVNLHLYVHLEGRMEIMIKVSSTVITIIEEEVEEDIVIFRQ